MATGKGSTPAYEALADSVIARNGDVARSTMFGMPCLTVGGKACLGAYAEGVVFKLPSSHRDLALGLAGAALFDPSGTRPMREWVVVPPAHGQSWDELADAAVDYVRPR